MNDMYKAQFYRLLKELNENVARIADALEEEVKIMKHGVEDE